MGYYSEVALCVKKGVLEKARLTVSEPYKLIMLDELLESAAHLVDPETGDELWHWESVKWYPDYEDIAVIENLIGSMDSEDYRFIRIGEDYDDNEVRGGHCDNPFSLSLSRNIIYERPENG